MNIGSYSVENKVISWLIVIILVAGGASGFQVLQGEYFVVLRHVLAEALEDWFRATRAKGV